MDANNESRNKNILIGALIAVVLIMGVGYAAFAQQLTINGSAEITSRWDVHIENIVAGTLGNGLTGTARDIPYDASTATDGTHKVSNAVAQFKTELVSPGDSLTYTVTVKNAGTLPAKVNKITFPTNADSDYILYSYTGIAQDEVIAAGASKEVKVTVAYKDVEGGQTQPATTTKTLTMQLDFVQA